MLEDAVVDKEYEGSDLEGEQTQTMENADGSFASFVNPTETQGDEGSLEVVFHNEQLFKMLGEKRSEDLDDFVKKPVFSNQENYRMSLLSAAMNRQSDAVLQQAFKLENEVQTNATQRHMRKKKKSEMKTERVIII